MSSKVDDRIVNMKFNHAEFGKGVSETTKNLETLKKGLDLKGVGEGFDKLAASAKNFTLNGIADGVQGIAGKFTALSVIGITALANIANKAVDAGLTIMRSLTVDPVKAGFAEYELKMGSIQTMLANTERYGTTLPDVTAALDDLNEYADLTIYNFGDMTKNIGLFTNAGIRIEDATSMIKGFSNAAAASGTSAQGASGAAYQLSQALSNGTVRLMDWKSLTNVGMGNNNMKDGLIQIATAMGTLTEETVEGGVNTQNFNETLEKGWLSADVMSSYLKIMAGDMDAAAMSAMGLSDEQISSFQSTQQTAQDAAQKVRTWTQLLGTLQEGVGSGWAKTFDLLLGDFNQATDLFSGVYATLSPIIDQMADARNNLIEAWAAGGGRESVIASVTNAWNAAVALIAPIKEAFQEIFPPMTAEKLLEITRAVENFTKTLMPSDAVLADLKSTFMGLFAVLDIGWMILQEVIGLFGRIFGAVGPASTGILGFTANIGDWLVSVRDAIKEGTLLGDIFDWIGDLGAKTISKFQKAGAWIAETFPLDDLATAWENVGKAVKAVWEFLQPFFTWVGEAFQNTKKVVKEAFETMDFNILVGLLNVGLLGGIFAVVKKFVDKLPGMFSGIGGGIFETIKGAFGELTNTMQAMQQKLKAETLIRIAIAIGILTAAVVALSFIDTAKLFISLGAMSIMFTQLMAAMLIMDRATASKGFAKMPFLAATMIGLATAMVIFAAAVAIMAQFDWNELARGVTGLGVGLGIMIGGLLLLDKVKHSISQSAGGLILMATGLVILASALKIMSTMSWDDIGRSMAVLAGGLAALAVGAKLIQGSVAGAAAMILVSTAVTILSGAMKVFATMSWDDIARSLVALGGALAILAVTMEMMEGSLRGAAAVVMVSGAMTILSGAFKIFATMSWDEIARALVLLGGSLAILAGAMALMGFPLVMAGSIGIIAASSAMMVLAPALVLLGAMSWDNIGRGLTMLAASLGILAVGGILLLPAIPAFLALGAAIALIGYGAMAAGVGMTLFAAGFLALAGAAALGADSIKMAATVIIDLIPMAMTAFADGLIAFALTIANGQIEFTNAMTTLLMALINAIGTVGPAVIETLWGLLMLMATKLEENVPILVEKGGNLIIGVLNGMSNKIPGIARAGTDLMIQLMRAISREVPRLANEGAQAIIRLVNGISSAIDNNAAAMGAAGGRLAASIVRGMVNGIGAGVGEIVRAAKDMASNALNAAKKFLGINSPSKEFHYLGEFSSEGYAGGLIDTLGMVQKAGTKVGETALYATKKSLAQISSAVASDMSMAPTIRPVLDLSAIKQDAALIGGILTPPTLKLNDSVAYVSQAQQAGYQAQESELALEMSRMGDGSGGDVNFYQTNNSPKALTSAEIYRRTNNQLSVAKKELTTIDTQ